MNEPGRAGVLEWGYASAPHPDETSSGDLHVLLDRDSGAIVSVMDGLGHGPEASQAVNLAADVLRHKSEAPLVDLIAECHHALRGSRGIALTLAEINVYRGTVSWAGIGNVEGRLLRAMPSEERHNESVLLRGGVVGYQIPEVKARTLDLYPGDVLIFGTDGLSPSFGDGVILNHPAQRIAEGIMRQHNRNKDDALVVVARYLGQPHRE